MGRFSQTTSSASTPVVSKAGRFSSTKVTTPVTKSTSRFSGITSTPTVNVKKLDLGTSEGLAQYAETQGLGKQAEQIIKPEQKLGALGRLSAGLGAFNPAEAILTGIEKKSIGAGLTEYGKDIATGVGSAITGKDYQSERRSFKEVAKESGIENKLLQSGIGFLGDVFLDPSTYFGGAIAKGLTTGIKGATKVGMKVVEKASPEMAGALKTVGEGLSDATGTAFKYGYKASKGAVNDIASFLGRENSAKIGLAGSNLDRLGAGVLSKSQQEELAMKLIAGKRTEYQALESGMSKEAAGLEASKVAQSSDPLVQKVIEAQKTRSAKFAEQAGIEDVYSTYFPFLKADKVKNFIDSMASQNIKVGSEPYRKAFKNILTDEAIEKNPAKAFFTSESQQVTDRMSEDFLKKFVKTYGKPKESFANLDEAKKAGYEILKTKGIYGEELGYIPKWDAKLIKDAISPEFQSVNMLAKATGFDAVTSLFKRSVTGLFAPFHIRNFASGMIQNYETLGAQALNPKNISVGQKIAYWLGKGKTLSATEKTAQRTAYNKVLNIGGKDIKFRDIIKPFEDLFSGDTFYNNDFDNILKSGQSLLQAEKLVSKARLGETIKTAGLSSESIPFKAARVVGQYIEHQQKATAYITALGQGKTIPEALELAKKAGFDYRELTRFESQILRRIIPFYSFTRKNIGLQLSTLGENPQRINQVLNFFENIGEPITPEEKTNLPEFIREAIGVKLQDTPEGLKQYITSFGTPIEAFTQLFGSNPILGAIAMTNPILKVPIEIGIGKDSFRQRDLKDVYQATEYKNAPQIIKDLLEIEEVDNPILKENEQGKLVEVGRKKQYVADPVKLLIARSLFTSRGVSYLDQAFGGDLKGFVKAIKLTTGIKPTQVDLEMQKSITETNKRRQLEDYLAPRTPLSKFSKTYINE